MRRSLFPLLAALLVACEGADDGALENLAPAADSVEAEPAGLEADPVADDAPDSAQFALGTHYRRLSPTQPTSSSPDRVEVAAVFSYGEPESYALEPEIERWRARLPAYVEFVRIPAVRDALERLHARAFFTAEALGRGTELHDALLRELQAGGTPLTTAAAVADLFARFGVAAAEFEAAFDSYDVHEKVQRAEELTRRYRVETVPTLVVNGKYTSDPRLAGGDAQLFAVIDFLAAAERAAR